MLPNPFTPSQIASDPSEFFGRQIELQTFGRSLLQGSVVIEGPMGIGKSSLLARGRLQLEGFDSDFDARTVVAVGDRDIETVDQAARLLLEAFTEIDEKRQAVKFKLGSVFEIESSEVCKYFAEGRHLAALKRMIEANYLDSILGGRKLFLLAIDEADKCPIPIARLIRSVITDAQQKGVREVRFAVAGVSPLLQRLVSEDPGINRFFYKTISLGPMSVDEASELVETKLSTLVGSGENVDFHPDVVGRIVALSGGHPHLIQLLGSHLVEHENGDPDGLIDSRDLANSLRRICYEDRDQVYKSMIHWLETESKIEVLLSLLGMSAEIPIEIISPGVPTRIDRSLAIEYCDRPSLTWLLDNNVIYAHSPQYYGLVDEFLRVRLIMDRLDRREDEAELEKEYIMPQYSVKRRREIYGYDDEDEES